MSNLTDTIKENITIMDYLNTNMIGYKKVGSYYQLLEMDSLMIKSDGKYFTRYSTGEHGSVIDFVMLYEKVEKVEAIKKLRYLLPNISYSNKFTAQKNVITKAKEKDKLVLPEKYSGKYSRIFAYLTKSRSISPNVVNDLLRRRLMYEDSEYHNVVWTGYDYDGEIKFACRRVAVDKERMMKYSLKKNIEQKAGVFLSEDKKHLLFINSVIKEDILKALLNNNSITDIYICHKDKEKEQNFLNLIQSLNVGAEINIGENNDVELKDCYVVQEPFIKGDVLGSDKKVGWFVNNQSTSVLVCEAPIDAMSLMSLLEYHNVNPDKYSYLAQGGVCLNSLEYHIKKNPKIETIYLCYDNDTAGHKARLDSREMLINLGFKGRIIDKPPHSKDWNEDLLGLNLTFNQIKYSQQIEQTTLYTKKEIKQW